MSTFETINLLFSKLTNKQKSYTYLAFSVMLISGLSEMFYIGAFLPFISSATDSENVWANNLIKNFALNFGIQEENLLLVTTIVFILAVIISSLVSIFNIYLTGRVCAKIGTELSTECFRRTIYQEYSFHTKNDKNEMTQNTSFRIARTIASLNLLLQTISSIIICIFIISGLIIISGKIAIILSILYGSIYYFIKVLVSKRQFSNGETINKLNFYQLKKLLEVLNSIKEILVNNNHKKYIEAYAKRDRLLRYREAEVKVIAFAPKYILQAVGVIALALTALILIADKSYSGVSVIPLLGTIAIGTQKLLPALQSIFKSWSGIKSSLTHVRGLLDALNLPLSKFETQSFIGDFNFCNNIEFHNVSFKHEENLPFVINKLNFKIYKGEKVGIIGKTGAGKSTLTDLLMGLIVPTTGEIKVDGELIHNHNDPRRLLAWRQNISHLPQDIFLFDESIKSNITSSSNSIEIDYQLLYKVCEVAQIKDFIINLPNGFDTIVGDNGIRLSGGQKQRIGIARALYKKHNILIFDEGTSALDNKTENLLMEAIEKFNKDATLIIIAHRLSTINRCDRIIELKNGNIMIS
tara:strand:- start:553 stop:2295 length:1743 start_codon:yes stop_codon:yes gene_type:complete